MNIGLFKSKLDECVQGFIDEVMMIYEKYEESTDRKNIEDNIQIHPYSNCFLLGYEKGCVICSQKIWMSAWDETIFRCGIFKSYE